MNYVLLIGTIEKDLVLDTSVCGFKYYATEVSTERASGQRDYIPILTPRDVNYPIGTRVMMLGVLRSQDYKENGKNKTRCYVYTDKISKAEDKEDRNEVCLDGDICKARDLRSTPLGRTIYDCILAVHTTDRITDYIPIIAWGKLGTILSEYPIKTKIGCKGRLQSRNYVKDNKVFTVYEVSISEFEVI